MGPGRQDADEQKNQNDNQDDSHTILLFSSFSFRTLSLLTKFQDVLGTTHALSFFQRGALFLHKQPRNLCNNKSESFLISFCLRPSLLVRHYIYSEGGYATGLMPSCDCEDHDRVRANSLPIAKINRKFRFVL